MPVGLETTSALCPYCWERIEFVVDCSIDEQEYIEDCEVCCRPILVKVRVIQGIPDIEVFRDH